MIKRTFAQYSDLRHALVHSWVPTADAGPLAGRAFLLLCDLTPARLQLFRLYSLPTSRKRLLSWHAISTYVPNRSDSAVKLAADLEEAETKGEEAANDARLVAIQDALLAQAGETFSLTARLGPLGYDPAEPAQEDPACGSALGVLKNGEILVPYLPIRGSGRKSSQSSRVCGR